MQKFLFALIFSSALMFTTSVKSSVAMDPLDLAKMVLAKQKLYADQYIGALNIFKEVLVKNPNDPEVLHFMGLCFYKLKQYDKALEQFTKAKEINKDVNRETYLYLGKIYQGDGKFEQAATEYTTYKGKASSKEQKEEDIEVYINQCTNAKNFIAVPVDVTVENMGAEINSKYDDGSPAISADAQKIVFNSRRPETTDAPMDVEGDGKFFQDIYISTFDTLTKKWKPAETVPGSVNTEAHDAVTSLSADGKQIYIYKNDVKGESRGGDIYLSKIVNGKWRTPEPMGKEVNTTYWEGGGCISSDGKTLIFTSERKGGFGNADIWVLKRISKHEWGKPENIGAEVNSAFDEVGVFLAPDNKTLFFCSNGNGSMGGYDIFKTTLENGKWTKPVNLGYPINSERKDGPFVLSADARFGYFASDRTGGLGESDIYKVDLKDYAVLEKDGKKKENNGLSILKGIVRDGYEGYGLPEVELDFTNAAGEKAGSTVTNENGEYFITLKGGVNYTVTLKKKGFKDLSETFELKLGAREAFVMDKEFLLKK